MNAYVVTEQWIESSPNRSAGEQNSLVEKCTWYHRSSLGAQVLWMLTVWLERCHGRVPSVCLSLPVCTYCQSSGQKFCLSVSREFSSFVNKEFSL